MQLAVRLTILSCAILYCGLLLVEIFFTQRRRPAVAEICLLLVALVLLNITSDFPFQQSVVSFGFAGLSAVQMVAIMFVCVMLGIVARQAFIAKAKVRWFSAFKPLLISPIVLFPLVGTMQDGALIQPMQAISFAILAFQNGFFWNLILDRVRQSA
jgi:hypothetical protein